jgi:hypothetical protein
MSVFVRSRYFSIPHTRARRKLAVARMLDKRKPEDPSADVERYAVALGVEIGAMTAAYVTRHVEASSVAPREDGELDTFVDALWGVCRDRFDHWRVFAMPAPARFVGDADAKHDYAASAAQAGQIRRARELLLGTGGVEFTRLKYVEQAEHMRTMWTVIEDEGLDEVIAAAIGPEFLSAMRDGQRRYLAMIERRLAAERGSEVDLRARSRALADAMQNYVLALLVALDESDADSLAQTRAALRPLDVLREQLERERSGAAAGEEVDEEVDEDLAELLAEEQQLAEELGADDPVEGCVLIGADLGGAGTCAAARGAPRGSAQTWIAPRAPVPRSPRSWARPDRRGSDRSTACAGHSWRAAGVRSKLRASSWRRRGGLRADRRFMSGRREPASDRVRAMIRRCEGLPRDAPAHVSRVAGSGRGGEPALAARMCVLDARLRGWSGTLRTRKTRETAKAGVR